MNKQSLSIATSLLLACALFAGANGQAAPNKLSKAALEAQRIKKEDAQIKACSKLLNSFLDSDLGAAEAEFYLESSYQLRRDYAELLQSTDELLSGRSSPEFTSLELEYSQNSRIKEIQAEQELIKGMVTKKSLSAAEKRIAQQHVNRLTALKDAAYETAEFQAKLKRAEDAISGALTDTRGNFSQVLENIKSYVARVEPIYAKRDEDSKAQFTALQKGCPQLFSDEETLK